MAREEVHEVADRVYDLGTKWVNFYLVVDGGRAIVIDGGYPRYTARLDAGLRQIGLTLAAIEAVLVTHHHADHVGVAELLRCATGATVFVGEGDASIVRGDWPSHLPAAFWQQSWRPGMVRFLLHSAVAGGARQHPVARVSPLSGDQSLDLPGRPRVVHTPGHTMGHYSVVLEERSVLFSGDAMVNFDYASGKPGLNLHRFNDDRELALSSLRRLEPFDAQTVLFGHGDRYTDGAIRAIDAVRECASAELH